MRFKERVDKMWTFAADRGGTFTDVLGVDSKGQIHHAKILSKSRLYQNSVLEGIRRILKKCRQPISPEVVSEIRVGTTICTNALLERKGSKVGLLTTSGFEDLIEIGDQARPNLFSLWIEKPDQLYHSVVGIRGRINAQGEIEETLKIPDVRHALNEFKRQDVEAVVILFTHSWKNPDHEKQVANIARENGFSNIICSHETLPLIKMIPRGQTALVDAYLASLFQSYILNLKTASLAIPIHLITSSGGIMDSEKIRAKDSILSGPAGGVVAAAAICNLLDINEAIGFDMGGTSTDVSRYDGEMHYVSETEQAGIKYQTDQLDVETVAAGGGSILGFDGQKITVGPESAGADPGPACYGKGGPLTVTDANLILGRILPDNMPDSFGNTGTDKLDLESTELKFQKLVNTINKATNTKHTLWELAEGFVAVANEVMSRAVRKISVAKGYDIRNHALICFGGAAPQHACSLGRSLGMRKIIIHPLAGILSAYGIAIAHSMERKVVAIMDVLTDNLLKRLEKKFQQIEFKVSENIEPDYHKNIKVKRYLDLRPLGSDAYLTVKVSDKLDMQSVCSQFLNVYRQRFGFTPDMNRIEVVNMRAEFVTASRSILQEKQADQSRNLSERNRVKTVKMYFNGKWEKTPVFNRQELKSGLTLSGPAVILDNFTTIVVEPDFQYSINLFGHLEMNAVRIQKPRVSTKRDPVLLELFNHRFMSIAEQMGFTLVNSAHSVNMKERLDFSCAIFDSNGDLVANAPHIPVHLGAMGDSVKTILADHRETFNRGDVFLINNPHKGGSHLPDLTVVSPVFIGRHLVFYVATRGHHADIGGRTPGSMPPCATSLEEEGVVIDGFLLVRDGSFREQELVELLSSGLFPARNILERISDLRAQCAANAKGIQALEHLVDEMSLDVVTAFMQHIQDNAAEAMEAAFDQFLGSADTYIRKFTDRLDEGLEIWVEIEIKRTLSGCRAKIDFSGTSPQMESNLNAPVSVVKSAVLYVLRTLVMRNIPLNAGCFRPVNLIVPEGSLLSPSPSAAVAGGNVETSQRVVDVLYGALGIAAASQGTMNNFIFGAPDGSGKQYYETIAGGSGATEGHSGASAVQVHMTNTRITDPEVLEHRFPNIRVDRFAIRKGSGGKGKWTGGDGTEREIRFLETMAVSLLSERRKYPPYGMKGGQNGKQGKNILVDVNGKEKSLCGKAELIVKSGEKIIVKTPGGGGFGRS